MIKEPINIKDLSLDELKTFLEDLGEKPFRAKQIFEWIYKDVSGFSDMTNLSKDLRNKLAENASLFSITKVDERESQKDSTRKFLFSTNDGELIESVFMEYRYGNSVCISSQAGCRMGCSFCASGMDGLARDLTPGEMIDQLILAQNETGKEIRHIVIMGTGEPFDNYDNVKKAVEIMCEPLGLGLSRRNITVSTCGLIPYIERFADDLPQVNLAISLHAPNDRIRNKILPVNAQYGISDIIKASRDYVKKTGRRITFEYALIKGLNDSPKQAEELAVLLRGINCHVNLIPLNNVEESGLKSTGRASAEEFMRVLEERKIQVTIRREMGGDIDAACGQLRSKG